MRPSQRILLIACLAAALLPASPSHAQHADREQIIDIGHLNEVMADATRALAEPLRETSLGQRFSEVNTLLATDRVDKVALVAALDGLSGELQTFVSKLDSAPLFEAEQQVGITIDRVRMLMATGPSGRPSREIKQQVEAHEQQLRELVAAIDIEPDPRRRQRLKLMFAHHLRLKRLKEQMGSVDLSDARMRVLARTALALDSLSTQLISAAFRTEEARVILGQQAEFVGTYVEILNGLVGAEEIARVLNGLGDSGSQLAPVIAELATIARQAAAFGEKMDEVAMSLSDQIEIVGGNIAAQTEDPQLLLEMDLDREMQRYRADTPTSPPSPAPSTTNP